ncbi:3957_t:CDS:2 [Dentiscutata erythropus]|uniref:3957_t:CDS:1 n=1 Tax=Dentiscutata erythropus TaxID=1348616 RepID=A0A9N9H405_9GLOM|nr:3957_t:CDS:2 [Dentiscutata erythropus]
MSVYWPDSELGRFENSVYRLFNDFFKDFDHVKHSGSVRRSYRVPPLDEQINLDIRDGALYISGESKQDEKFKEGNVHIQERRYGAFFRVITLPRNVKTDEINAKFENGIIETKIPKT